MTFSNLFDNIYAYQKPQVQQFVMTPYFNPQLYTPLFQPNFLNSILNPSLNLSAYRPMQMSLFGNKNFFQPQLNLNNDLFNQNYNIFGGNSNKNNIFTNNSHASLTSVKTTKPQNTSNNNSDVKNIQWWKSLGYNPQKGKELMNYMRGHVTGFKGNCVGVVREGINHVYYGGQEHYKRFRKACNVGKEFLSTDKNFRKVTGLNLANLDPKDIPEGVIIIYGPGYSRKHPECGHGEVSNGQGRGYSDGITYIKNSGKQKIQELWIPV